MSPNGTSTAAGITNPRATGFEPFRIRRATPLRITFSVGAVAVVCGTNGHSERRPKIVSRAGSSVSIESAAQATPMAPIGPSPAVPLTLAMVRHSNAATTVAADANTAGPAERIASAIA